MHYSRSECHNREKLIAHVILFNIVHKIKSSDAQGQCEAKVRFRCPTGENDYFGELFVLRRFKSEGPSEPP